MRAVLDIAQEAGLVVTSVEYRLAPEHPYPAAVDDCFAGLEWTAAHAAELGSDSGRVLLCGASAGGGLAAAAALLARDRQGPAITAQMLICPMPDHRNSTSSSHQMAGQSFRNRHANDTGWAAYLPGRDHGVGVSPYASPALAGDLSGLPPAYLDVGSVDTFATRSSRTLTDSGGRAVTPNCTCGPAVSTASSSCCPSRYSHPRPGRPASTGRAGS
ncbi:alpha/beta hydrolase fold domain-containing protein [Streptomyces sp. R-07]|uniref:alpha/beta hydrolase fold domain-containing protein n=1 Tax=unclassified Streptomyces TaxID=2593676 RepID=UPI003427D036